MTSPIVTPFPLVKQLVESEQIDKLVRSPECTEKYQKHKHDLASKGYDMTTYLLVHELRWLPETVPLTTSSDLLIDEAVKPLDQRPFANAHDITIIPNSFPYNLEPDVTHLCVWVKSPMPPDPNSPIGDIPAHTKKLIELYVQETFCKWLGIPRENIAWFKNWAHLQSVKAIPHVHVLVKGLTQDQLDKVLYTGGKPIDYTSLNECKL